MLVRILLFFTLWLATLPASAQSSTPDYIAQAQTGVKKYYPEYEEYFNPIFTRTFKLSISSQNIINTKIHENFDLFDEELPTEKDKVTTILLVLEKVISGQDQLSRSIEKTTKGKDLIEIAEEISNDANQQARADRDQVQQETNLLRKRNDKTEEIINLMKSNEKSKETIGKIVDKMEEYFTLFDIKEIKTNNGLQEMIKQYINLTKQINRAPSNIGKSFIDEYNKL